MRVQFIKIAVLLALLSLPFAFPTAQAKKNAGDQATVGVEKVAPKKEADPVKEAKIEKKKKKKEKATEKKNYLTNEDGRKLLHEKFDVPDSIRPAVDFWKMVYSKYDRRFEVFHDIDTFKIYSVLDFTDLYNNMSLTDDMRREMRKTQVDAEKERIRIVLATLGAGPVDPKTLTPEEKKIYDLFKDNNSPEAFLAASQSRIRSQTGIADKFQKGVQLSGAYMEEFEDIFNSYGVPVEISRLCFVESMFNTRARSKVGASGIWQFMPSTGKLYLNIDGVVDERNDPIRATHAAAKLLRSNYDALGSWPLAINAYNSGRGTMSKAVSVMGTTDIATIIMGYSGGVYGFASRNFFPSFLAALEVANHYPKYFGDLKREKPFAYEEYSLRTPAYFGGLVNATGLNYSEIADYNSQFNDAILSDQKKIPPGYSIRIPRGTSGKFLQAEAASATPTSVGASDLRN